MDARSLFDEGGLILRFWRSHGCDRFVSSLRLFLLFVVIFYRSLQAFDLLLRNDQSVAAFTDGNFLIGSSLGFPNLVVSVYLGVSVNELVVLTVVDGVDSLRRHWHLSVYQVCI